MKNGVYEYAGLQENYPTYLPAIPLYTLLRDVPGHPKGSTLTLSTLIKEGLWKGEF